MVRINKRTTRLEYFFILFAIRDGNEKGGRVFSEHSIDETEPSLNGRIGKEISVFRDYYFISK